MDTRDPGESPALPRGRARRRGGESLPADPHRAHGGHSVGAGERAAVRRGKGSGVEAIGGRLARLTPGRWPGVHEPTGPAYPPEPWSCPHARDVRTPAPPASVPAAPSRTS